MQDPFHEMIERIATYAALLAGLAAVFAFLFGRDRLPEWIRSLRAESWRTASGSVETTDVAAVRWHGRSGFGGVELAKASLGYSYQVDGIFHSGYYSKAFIDEQAAWDWAGKWKGRCVMIRYNPEKPEVSVLRMQDQMGGGVS